MPHKKSKRSIREQESTARGTDLAPTATTTNQPSKKRKSPASKKNHTLDNEPLPKSLSRVLNAVSIRSAFKRKRGSGDVDEAGERIGRNEDSGVKRRKVEEKTGKKDTGVCDVKKSKKKVEQKVEKDKSMQIQPGETLGHFNRRVEDNMRPLVKTAMQTSRATTRAVQRAEIDAKAAKKLKAAAKSAPDPDQEEKVADEKAIKPPVDKHASSAKEFVVLSSRAPKRLNDIAQAPPEFTSLPRGAGKKTGAAGSVAQFGSASSDGEELKSKKTPGRAFAGVLSMAQKTMMAAEREGAIKRYREMKAAARKNGGGGDERDREGVDGEEVD